MLPALLLLTLLAPRPAVQDTAEIPIESVLTIGRAGRGGRVAVFTDAVEAALARGTWTAPREGGVQPVPDGEPLSWTRVEAEDSGWMKGPDLRGGWAHATVERQRDQVLLLDASGHRHVYVNGEPRGGDLYGLGITRLPVKLVAGTNELLFRAGRGRLRAKLVAPPAPVFFEDRDRTLPDVVLGAEAASRAPGTYTGPSLYAGLILTNATESALEADSHHVWVLVEDLELPSPVPSIPAVSSRKVPVVLPAVGTPGERTTYALELRDAAGDVVHRTELALDVKRPGEKHRRTFRSAVDGSVQYFAVTPPAPAESDTRPPAMFLSLHGASVEATNQAYSYAPKDWGVVVAPTNRRPYGFDWEDWGRLDALEVLAIAEELYDTDPRRTYLTGHSMGGHGTWNLGAHLAGRFAAIAPSAGWRDFWSYGGALTWDEPTPVQALLLRAANGSRTLLLEENYAAQGVYVLHGDRDDNVPVTQARFMRERLATYHPNFAYYERPGAGHWWGNQCVDWPPLFEFLARNVLPKPHAIRRVAFTTVSPGIHARTHWVTIEAQVRSMEPSRIEAELAPDERRITATMTNVARLSFDLEVFAAPRSVERAGETVDATVLPAGEPLTLVIDGGDPLEVPWPATGATLSLAWSTGIAGWVAADSPDPALKGPHRAGPFKDAFRHRMVFVHGTQGTPEETAWARSKARYDAETFAYRGNGAVDVVADADFDPQAERDRGVVLYGNADTCSVWAELLGAAPIEVTREHVVVGERTLAGEDLACLFLHPRPGSAVACVAAVSGTGVVGCRVTNQLPVFVSGVGYPDWTVIGADMLEQGSSGVRAAGFFDERWALGKDLAVGE